MSAELRDGIPCYAPEIAGRNEGFPAEKFDRLFDAETRNFWYRSRSRLIVKLALAYLRPGARFIEIGCGTGSQLRALADVPGIRLMGAEAYLDGIKLARRRLPGVDFVQLDAARMPFEAEFDGAGLFDMLEHVEDDLAVLRGARRALKPGGVALITVPQHRWLWSANDEAAFHKRRYERAELRRKLDLTGFQTLRMTSLVSLLLPLMCLVRRLKGSRPRHADPYQSVLEELELPASLNVALDAAMRLDELAIAAGADLPAGGTLAAVARAI